MNPIDQIEQLLAAGGAHSIYVGNSVLPWRKRFATIRTGAGETVATGDGNTATEALADALSKIGGVTVKLQTRPVIPGLTRRIPGL